MKINTHSVIILKLFTISVWLVNICSCNNSSETDNGKLIFAHVVFRHGDRNPIDPYPNDPWRNITYWPEGYGQLTNIGKEQHYQLGQFLRRRYSEVLNESVYNTAAVYVQSTDVDRTLMSASSNLAGLFPPNDNQVWNEQIRWQPVPIHTIPETLDHVLAAKRDCPKYEYALKKYKNSQEYKEMVKKYKPLYEYLTEKTGRKVNGFTTVENLYNTLYIEDLYNRTLPEWTKKVYPGGDMKWIADRSFATSTFTPQLARLKTGFLLKDILQRFTNKTKSQLSPNRNLWIYSGHDTTIANLLNTLGLFEYHSPPYTACIMLELREIRRNYYIQVFYRNTSVENPKPLNIPNCGPLCPLDKMYELYNAVLPGDFESECQLSMLSMTYEDANFGGSTMGFTVTGIFIVLILLMVVITIKKYKKYHYHDSTWYLRIDS